MKVTLFHLVLALPSIAFAQAIPKPLPVSERGPRVRVGSFCIDELYDRCEDGEVVLRKCGKISALSWMKEENANLAFLEP